MLFIIQNCDLFKKQECIPVGCVPPAHWPYLVVSHASPLATMYAPHHHTCPLPPRMPPLATMHAPPHHHTCPLPPCMSPATTHAPLLPCMSPAQPPRMPSLPPHPPPPPPPRMPPHLHACTPCHHAYPLPPRLSPCGQTDTCKNITFANFVCGR